MFDNKLIPLVLLSKSCFSLGEFASFITVKIQDRDKGTDVRVGQYSSQASNWNPFGISMLLLEFLGNRKRGCITN